MTKKHKDRLNVIQQRHANCVTKQGNVTHPLQWLEFKNPDTAKRGQGCGVLKRACTVDRGAEWTAAWKCFL